MQRCRANFMNPAVFFAAGFFVGLFVKFLPLFIVLMLLFLAAGAIHRLILR
ncbi:MAG: hypothetical protein IJA17_07110 [Oscillospiraceae bacterium]|nr:hypothetical protein [Oscillospiraceae bacterium]MBQ4642789.1 hypothetical protein [Oscillospiraceae bacterium]